MNQLAIYRKEPLHRLAKCQHDSTTSGTELTHSNRDGMMYCMDDVLHAIQERSIHILI